MESVAESRSPSRHNVTNPTVRRADTRHLKMWWWWSCIGAGMGIATILERVD
jgi:hypothetical protein